jgi:hypothetical protein
MELCWPVSLISSLLYLCLILFIYYSVCVSSRFVNNSAPLALTRPLSHFLG